MRRGMAWAGRILFVVGEAEAEAAADLLKVAATDGGHARGARTRKGSKSAYLKLSYFLRYAATQPEPVVGRADDDSFVSLAAVQAYAAVLRKASTSFYAGVFEWYNCALPPRRGAEGRRGGGAEGRRGLGVREAWPG